jgi:hypothetical protein
MDELGISVTVNGERRTDGGTPLQFTGIPNSYDEDNEPEATESNSITVTFNETVILSNLEVASGASIPGGTTVILRDLNGNPFTNENGDEVATEPISVDNGLFIFPDDLPPLTDIKIIVVSSDQPEFVLTPEFIGCVHPGINV